LLSLLNCKLIFLCAGCSLGVSGAKKLAEVLPLNRSLTDLSLMSTFILPSLSFLSGFCWNRGCLFFYR